MSSATRRATRHQGRAPSPTFSALLGPALLVQYEARCERIPPHSFPPSRAVAMSSSSPRLIALIALVGLAVRASAALLSGVSTLGAPLNPSQLLLGFWLDTVRKVLMVMIDGLLTSLGARRVMHPAIRPRRSTRDSATMPRCSISPRTCLSLRTTIPPAPAGRHRSRALSTPVPMPPSS
jgi:hypothetical protein